MAYGYNSGTSAQNRAIVVSGLSGNVTISFRLLTNAPLSPRAGSWFLFDGRYITGNSYLYGNAGSWYGPFNVTNFKINGVSKAYDVDMKNAVIGDVISFQVSASDIGSGFTLFNRFTINNEVFENTTITDLAIIDDAGTHGLSFPSSGNTVVDPLGTLTITIQNGDDSQWVYYNSITTTGIPNNTLGAALNQPCAINLNNYFPGATSYSVLSGSLPTGLSIVGNEIVGTPTTAQSTTLVIRASNAIDVLDSATITFNTGLWYLTSAPAAATKYISVNIPASTLNAGRPLQIEWEIEFEAARFQNDFPISSDNNSSGNTLVFLKTGSNFELRSVNNSNWIVATGLNLSDFNKFRIRSTFDGATHIQQLFVNDGTTPIATRNPTTAAIGAQAALLSLANSTRSGGLKYYKFTDFVTPANNRHYDASASGGVGNLLIDRVSNQNGTQAGTWPSDNSEWVSYAPAGGGELNVTLGSLSSPSTLYAPTVTKDKLIKLQSISSAEQVYNLGVTQDKLVSPSSIPSNSTVYNPSVAKGVALVIGLEPISSTSVVYGPSVLADKRITPVFFDSVENVWDVTLLKDKLILLEALVSTSETYVPEVIGGAIPLPSIELFQDEGYGLHIRTAKEMNDMILALAKRIQILEQNQQP